MRKATLVLAALISGFCLQTASALDAQDGMAAWAAASSAERAALVDQLMANESRPGHASRSELLACLDAASSVTGHEGLTIEVIAQACLHPAAPGDEASPLRLRPGWFAAANHRRIG